MLLLLYQKEAQTQVFSCEYCDIFKNSFFKEQLWWLLLNTVSAVNEKAAIDSEAYLVPRQTFMTKVICENS